MAEQRIRIIWGSRRQVPGRWYLGVIGFYAREGRRRDGLVVSLRGVLGWSAAGAVLAYVALAVAWVLWLERRPYNFVTYADALLAPVRWEEIKRKRGEAFIAEGMDDFRRQRWGEGAMKIRVGLARQPDAREARLQLAAFFVAVGLRERGITTLREGLALTYPGRKYVEALVRLLVEGENFAEAREVLTAALSKTGPAVEQDRGWLEMQAARLDLGRGEAAAVLAWTERQPVTDGVAAEMRVLALVELKRPIEALTWLDEWSEAGGEAGVILRLRVRAAREAGDREMMMAALEALRALTPANPTPYIYGVIQRALCGEGADAEGALDDFFFRFGARLENLERLAEPLITIKREDLFRRLEAWITEHGLRSAVVRRMRVDWEIAQGNWGAAQAALAEFDVLKPTKVELGEWREVAAPLLAAAVLPGEGAQRALIELLRSRRMTLVGRMLVIETLQRAERWATAQEVIGLAQREHPDHPGLKEARTAVEVQLALRAAGQAEQSAALAATMTQARVEVGEAAAAVAASATPLREEEFFTLVEGHLREGELAETLAAVRDVRRLRPAWLNARQVDVLRVELEVQERRRDLVALQSIVRQLLDGSNARGLEVMKLVERLDADGRRGDARQIVTEVLRRQPGFPPAVRQLAAWDKRPATE